MCKITTLLCPGRVHAAEPGEARQALRRVRWLSLAVGERSGGIIEAYVVKMFYFALFRCKKCYYILIFVVIIV